MLLFKLPWLCHGVRLSLTGKPGPNASLTDELSSQQSVSLRSGSDLDGEINAQLRLAQSQNAKRFVLPDPARSPTENPYLNA